jgi:hypothetical protein
MDQDASMRTIIAGGGAAFDIDSEPEHSLTLGNRQREKIAARLANAK